MALRTRETIWWLGRSAGSLLLCMCAKSYATRYVLESLLRKREGILPPRRVGGGGPDANFLFLLLVGDVPNAR